MAARKRRAGVRKAARARLAPTVLPADEARALLVGHHGLRAVEHPPGAAGVRALLDRLRHIQLDPLDPLGTNADLVALARLDGLARGEVYAHAYPGHAFEHWAKERCLLPARAFPWYRDRSVETPWWRLSERWKRLPAGVVEEVLAEVRARGPVSARDLADRGRVKPMSWHGWKSTAKASSMALDILWTRCDVVVCGRGPKGKLYDVPERALPQVAAASPGAPASHGEFHRWALLERVEAAGLLSRAGGATWSSLEAAREGGLVEELIDEGLLEEFVVEGSARPYLAPRGLRDRCHAKDDGRLRLLGPLDPLLWDRGLVKAAFGFDYVWEVYKPEHLRRWGWYVCPLLHRGELVGRLDAAVERGALRVRRLWEEPGRALDEAALAQALARHARACGVERVVMPRARRRS